MSHQRARTVPFSSRDARRRLRPPWNDPTGCVGARRDRPRAFRQCADWRRSMPSPGWQRWPPSRRPFSSLLVCNGNCDLGCTWWVRGGAVEGVDPGEFSEGLGCSIQRPRRAGPVPGVHRLRRQSGTSGPRNARSERAGTGSARHDDRNGPSSTKDLDRRPFLGVMEQRGQSVLGFGDRDALHGHHGSYVARGRAAVASRPDAASATCSMESALCLRRPRDRGGPVLTPPAATTPACRRTATAPRRIRSREAARPHARSALRLWCTP